MVGQNLMNTLSCGVGRGMSVNFADRALGQTVADLLRPGGRLFIREAHPMLWALSDPRPDGLFVVEFPYFESGGGTLFRQTKTYVEHEGVRLEQLIEHDSAPWNPLGEAMQLDEDGEWRLREKRSLLPLTYTLQARKV